MLRVRHFVPIHARIAVLAANPRRTVARLQRHSPQRDRIRRLNERGNARIARLDSIRRAKHNVLDHDGLRHAAHLERRTLLDGCDVDRAARFPRPRRGTAGTIKAAVNTRAARELDALCVRRIARNDDLRARLRELYGVLERRNGLGLGSARGVTAARRHEHGVIVIDETLLLTRARGFVARAAATFAAHSGSGITAVGPARVARSAVAAAHSSVAVVVDRCSALRCA